MPESNDWMPTTWAGKAAMFSNVGVKIGLYAVPLGLSLPEVTAAQDLCDEYTAVYNYYTTASAAGTGLTAWRDKALSGPDDGKGLDDPPAFGTFSMPANATNGVIAEFRKMRDSWVSAAGYTEAIGEDLMIVGTGGEGKPESDVTPVIHASAAESGYLVGLTVSDRDHADQWIVETRQNGGNWQNAGSFTGKTADVHITPTNPGKPEQVDIRVRLRRKNADYGNPSQIATVTVNP